MLIRSIIFDIQALIEDINQPVFCSSTFETLIKLKACNLRLIACSDSLNFNELTLKLMQTQLKHFFDYFFAIDNSDYEVFEFSIDFMELHVKECLILAPNEYQELVEEDLSSKFIECNSPKELSFPKIEEIIEIIKIKNGVIETLEKLQANPENIKSF